ncbi:12787_t:CDS:2 [Funneliformis caledonium]|uniref:12787_t:CDS:1 n=2 Tax=Funneliformis TaxID=1117308 RepID=A0A9N9ED64_9GLOM|nr:5453_t:CDS:2 [Funneliformis mosseae]CAG8673729.1 12787_t:CDS:2 [Funneliformis caledonium]
MPPKKDAKDTKTSKSKETDGTTKKAPTAYNIFMKTELPKVKAENPGMDHKEAFKLAASNWKNSADNPKNKAE